MRSARSSSSGEGGLWLVRIAFAPMRLQDLELALGGAPVDGRAERAEVVVVADALEAHAAAVEQEALLRPELDRADAERRRVAVEHARRRA